MKWLRNRDSTSPPRNQGNFCEFNENIFFWTEKRRSPSLYLPSLVASLQSNSVSKTFHQGWNTLKVLDCPFLMASSSLLPPSTDNNTFSPCASYMSRIKLSRLLRTAVCSARDALFGIVSIHDSGHTYIGSRIQGKCGYPCLTPNVMLPISVCSAQDSLLGISICETGKIYTG